MRAVVIAEPVPVGRTYPPAEVPAAFGGFAGGTLGKLAIAIAIAIALV